MVVAEVKIIPIGTKSPSVSEYVAKAINEIDNSNLKHELTPSGTIIEGELEEILEVVKKMHNCVFDNEVSRIVTFLEIDDRRDKDLSIEGKRESANKRLEKYQ